MSIVIAVAVTYGFSRTMGGRLIHPKSPRPTLLYVHAAVFFGWLVFYIVQSAPVRSRHTAIHKRLGWFGMAAGVAIVILGASTAIMMSRLHLEQDHFSLAEASPAVPLFDITCFAVIFTLAIVWRKRPEFHRRLIFVASCVLTAAGLGRFPAHILSPDFFYLGVDGLIFLGVARDLIVTGRVHNVYAWSLPSLATGQAIVMYTEVAHPPFWLHITKLLLS
jgi:hypothetical protein